MTPPVVAAHPLEQTPDEGIGFQAQCMRQDWNSEVMSDHALVVADGHEHEERTGHGVAVVRVARIRRGAIPITAVDLMRQESP